MRFLLLAALAAASLCLCPSDVTARPWRRARRPLPSARLHVTPPRYQRLRWNQQRQLQQKAQKKLPTGAAVVFRQRVRELSPDPAHGNQITPNSRREGLIGATLEARGVLPGPVKREPTGKSEFVDAHGVRWDVKAFNSKYLPKQGGFTLAKAVKKLAHEFKGGERVILDTKDLSKPDRQLLAKEIARRGWASRVIWFP
jgi:hypothetical protein